jgi:septal ring factor EnvC (AmiA/AmiB activator)
MQYGRDHWSPRALSGGWRTPIFLAVITLALAAGAVAPASTPQARMHSTRARLQAVRAQIERIIRRVRASRIEQSRLTASLRAAEQSVGAARAALQTLRERLAADAARQAALAARKRQRQAALDRSRHALADELRAAYLIGREGPLTLLLNQGDPSRMGRMFAYYSYFSRARAHRIHAIEADLRQIDQLDTAMQAEDAQLASLERQRQAQLDSLDEATARRKLVLAGIAARTRTRTQRLVELRRQQMALESLLAALRRAEARSPVEHGRFAGLQGHLPWPVAGRLVARYGQLRAGGLRWDGDLIATRLDAPVRAVAPGRVIYADWLAGLGLLIIVDHGNGYMSLYGHNDRLYAHVGEWVKAGQLIAEAGDSGGAARPELYFGIRKGTRPVDPRLWLEHHAR